MAFRSSLARLSRHISAYSDAVDRFLLTSTTAAPSAPASPSTPSSSSKAATTPASSSFSPSDPRHPFKPYRNPATGRWAPAQFSQRRQAKLASLALETGRLDILPQGPKTDRIRARLDKLEQHMAFESIADQVRYAPRPRKGPSTALETAKVEGYKGPYTGRKVHKMFKGSKVERDAVKRRKNIKKKLENMNVTVEEWQAAKEENKAKFKPSLPF